MPQAPKILTRREVAASALFKVYQADLQFSNGERRTYEYLKSGATAAVIIVPVRDDGQVLLVREYGIGVNAYEWSLPKGRVDAGESHRDAANRELMEEAGFGARELHLLNCMTQSPSYMEHRTQIVLARDLYPEKREGDEPEALEVMALPLHDIAAQIERFAISEARTIAALYLARDWLEKSARDETNV